jgi:hypothetical protein
MRFGAKHNDIYPLLADMFRWKLELPSRHNKTLSHLQERIAAGVMSAPAAKSPVCRWEGFTFPAEHGICRYCPLRPSPPIVKSK